MAFGWGIVSTGKHPDIKIAPAIAAGDGGELVGVYSRDQQRAEAFARKHHARAAYSRLGDLLKDSRVDGVFVASPNALHAEHVVQAAEAGKHVLCEKPMATTIADAVRMVKACRHAGVTLGVAFNLRQHPAYRRARELVAAGLAQRAKGEGRTYDRFRRRIMFPLCDQRGRVLGFGARAMGADQKPKYLNSSDGLVFHKGRHLFGADIARTPWRITPLFSASSPIRKPGQSQK